MLDQRKSNKNDGFGLSFLDVLCCGLGSAILLLLIVKHEGTSLAATDIAAMAEPEVIRLKSRARANSRQGEKLNARLDNLKKESNRQRLAALSITQNGNFESNKLSMLQLQIEAVEEKIKGLAILEKRLNTELDKEAREAPTVDLNNIGALEGIKLSGHDKVAILLDVSASMLHWSVVEITRLQASSAADIKAASKWRQAILSAQYAYKTLDAKARFKLILFSESIYNIENIELRPENIQWDIKTGSHDGPINELSNILPRKGTNLKIGLDTIGLLIPKPDRILLITDGLPGKVSDRKKLSGCPQLHKRTTPITSECRLSIAIKSSEILGTELAKVPIDVILLPLDGDSGAVRFYSLVSGVTSGKLITPSVDWLLR